jgi:B3 DNA binding domain
MRRDCKKCSKWKRHNYWSHMDQTKKCFYKKMDASSFMKTLASIFNSFFFFLVYLIFYFVSLYPNLLLWKDASEKLNSYTKYEVSGTEPPFSIFYILHSQDLPNDFHRNFKGQIGETAELKGPSGNVWQVGVIKSTGRSTFQSGWKDFVTGNRVEANDLLVFKYSGNSSFQVQIFDSSGCERTSSFFARREQTEVQESSDSSIEISEGSDHDRHENNITISSSSSDSEYSIDRAPVRMPRRKAGKFHKIILI